MKFSLIVTVAAIGLFITSAVEKASADTNTIVATYYKNGKMLVDDSHAQFEVISNSSGNPMHGDTVRLIRWSNGTVTTISTVDGKTYMGGHPANSYGVDHLGGRIYEAYCTDNNVGERVCYKFN